MSLFLIYSVFYLNVRYLHYVEHTFALESNINDTSYVIRGSFPCHKTQLSCHKATLFSHSRAMHFNLLWEWTCHLRLKNIAFLLHKYFLSVLENTSLYTKYNFNPIVFIGVIHNHEKTSRAAIILHRNYVKVTGKWYVFKNIS